MHRVYPRKTAGSTLGFVKRSLRSGFVLTALVLAYLAPHCQGQSKKNVLMIMEIGQSHPAPALVTNQILSALGSDPRFDAELHWENLDAIDLSDDSRNELRDGIVRKYRNLKWDLIVLVGPDPLRLFAEPSRTFYPGVPVVFCCSSASQAGQRSADSRATGSWLHWEPAKTLDAAIRMLPDTRQVFVIAGRSRYDRGLTALVKAELTSYENRLDVTYLTDLPMNKLLERMRHLPSHSIVLYLTFFKDIEEREFLNSIDVLPKLTAASNSPVFGISDTYLGRGIVGGCVVSFEEQGKIAARDVIDILGGKPPRDIPIVDAPGTYLFDWRELQRWKLDESRLPAGSTILFRQPTLWEQYKQTLLIGLLIIVGLSLLSYLSPVRAEAAQPSPEGSRATQRPAHKRPGTGAQPTRSRDSRRLQPEAGHSVARTGNGSRRNFRVHAGSQSANAGTHGISQRTWCRSAHPVAPAAFFHTGKA